MPEAVVLYDAIRYTDAKGHVLEALKGDSVSLSSSEFDRLSSFKGREGNPEPAVEAPKAAKKGKGKGKAAPEPEAEAEAGPAEPEPEAEAEPEAEPGK